MPKALAFFQGKVVPVSEARVSVMTHALHYGTAVFEGVRGNWNADQGKLYVFRMREHYERFIQGCRIMMLDIPYSVDDLCRITVELLQSCGYRQDVYVRPLAYKSEERVANLILQQLESDFTLVIVPFGSYIEAEGAIQLLHLLLEAHGRYDHPSPGEDIGTLRQQHPREDGGCAGRVRRGDNADSERQHLGGLGGEPVPGVQRRREHPARGGEQPDGHNQGLRDQARQGGAWAGGRRTYDPPE